MENQTAVAAPSAAETQPSLEIPRSGTPEYAQWRMTGELPEKKSEPKPADPAPADAEKEQTTDDAADSAAKAVQEKPTKRRPDIETRFKQYTDRIDRLERELEEARRPKPTQAEPSPARPAQPQNYQEWRKTFKPTEWMNGFIAQNPESTWEDANAAMADHLGDVRESFREREQTARQQASQLQSKVDDARSRYGDQFDGVLSPTVQRIMGDQSLSQTVKAMLNDSEVLPDLVFTLGSDSAALDSFLKMPQGKQIRYVAALEAEIQAELSKTASRNDKGQFQAQTEAPAPAKRGPESAPEPPIEIGHRGTGSMDESERALQAAQRGDANAFRSWKQAEDRKAIARRRGA